MTGALPPLAVTMGEPAGIGGDIALKCWLRRGEGLPPFLLLDDAARLLRLASATGLDVPVRVVGSGAEAAAAFADALPVVEQPLARPVAPGRPDPANAGAVRASIERAVDMALAGEAAAVVTNPLHKQVMYGGGFAFPGHTEFLAALADDRCGGRHRPVMMLACPGLRVVPVTVHVALRDAVAGLRREDIETCGRITAQALARDFGIAWPRLAVAGLNPHAGEGGAMGREEIDVIVPAIEALHAEGIAVDGPLSADTMFHENARAGYDAALCMYHDQALIPLKTLDFENGINITLGLPFVRTSPDHGTALDLAGTGRASEASLMAALRQAARMAERRAAAARG